jgi:hypothetical protein
MQCLRSGPGAGPLAHHPAVAPEAARVQHAHARPGLVGQQPHLRRQRVHAVPGVDAQHGQPELAPAGDVGGAPARVDLRREGGGGVAQAQALLSLGAGGSGGAAAVGQHWRAPAAVGASPASEVRQQACASSAGQPPPPPPAGGRRPAAAHPVARVLHHLIVRAHAQQARTHVAAEQRDQQRRSADRARCQRPSPPPSPLVAAPQLVAGVPPLCKAVRALGSTHHGQADAPATPAAPPCPHPPAAPRSPAAPAPT